MAKKKHENDIPEEQNINEAAAEQSAEQNDAQEPQTDERDEKIAALEAELKSEKDKYLRLAAEYDNFRKRSQKEREGLYSDVRSDTILKILPVYDNLARALNQETEDEAYKKGVEMTMTQLTGIFEKLGVTAFGEAGEAFDPTLHNAVMHAEDESAGENVILEVFQKGFRIGEKVVRFAMVKVAN